MSTDPNSGIAFVTMFDSTDGQLTDGVQFTGVLIAPDELLSVAHGPVDENGNIRNAGTAYLGYGGGTLTGGDAITGVHVLDTTHRSGGMDDDTQVTTDFSVIHLAQPVADAAVFGLGLGTPGTYTVSGYPAIEKGDLTSVTERLDKGIATGELTGNAIVPNVGDQGASGSPAYSVVDGVPTVAGILAAGDDVDSNYLLGLTQSQVDQIKAWVYSDDASEPWGSAYAPVPATPHPTPTPPPPPPSIPAPVDRLDQLATLLRTASGAEAAPKATMVTDVATALTMAAARGYDGTDIPDAAYETAAILSHTSWTPRKSIAYLAGLMANEAGVARGQVLDSIATAFGLSVGKALDPVVMAGYADDRGFGSTTTSAPIATPAGDGWSAQTLAAALNPAGSMSPTHGVAEVGSSVEMASIVVPQTDGGVGHRIA